MSRTLIALLLAVVTAAAAAQTPQPVPNPSARPGAAAGPVPAPPPPTLSARSWVLMDFATGRVLASREPELSVEPASITKLMTSYIVADAINSGKLRQTDPVSISEYAWRTGGAGTTGSTSFLKIGSQVPVEDLVRGMVVQSGNDASIALAEHVAGSEEAFAQLMNEYATRVGMTGSYFLNSTGLPADGHVTTALDVARLGRAMIRDFPDHYRTYSIKEYTWNGITQHNRNTLLWRDATVDGIKTGHTSRAGYCLAASAQRGDTRMIAVVMGTASEKVRADEAQALLNYGFRVYESRTVYAPGATVAEPRLYKGEAEYARLGVAAPLVVTIPRGAYDRMQAAISIPSPLLAPLAAGQEIGKLTLTLDGETVAEAPLVAVEARPEGGFVKRLSDSVRIWIDSD
jgi:D-alanyl-D-alanine carboxypeptidase (penicillin-binding protein 5/6)